MFRIVWLLSWRLTFAGPLPIRPPPSALRPAAAPRRQPASVGRRFFSLPETSFIPRKIDLDRVMVLQLMTPTPRRDLSFAKKIDSFTLREKLRFQPESFSIVRGYRCTTGSEDVEEAVDFTQEEVRAERSFSRFLIRSSTSVDC